MEITLYRTEQGVRPADDATSALFRGLGLGEVVTAAVKRNRSLRHHRLFFGLLTKIADATGRWPNAEALLFTLKIELGYCDLVERLDGTTAPHPKSISFGTMDQAAFREFYDGSIRVLEEHVLPNIADMPEVQEIYAMIDSPDRRVA